MQQEYQSDYLVTRSVNTKGGLSLSAEDEIGLTALEVGVLDKGKGVSTLEGG